MSVAASETLTFLMTDIEGSTRLWQRFDGRMREAVRRHDELAAEIVPRHRGRIVKSRGEGDSLFIVFGGASDACACACALQQAFCTEPWPIPEPLRVRMALHTGATYGGENDYYGAPINRCARIRGAAHGGQILLSEPTAALAREIGLPDGVFLRDLKSHRLRDLEQPEQLFQLCRGGLPLEFPPPNSLEIYAHNLPLQLTGFIGREREIGTVKELLESRRILTLRGPGGCGKTRLALQVAAEVIERFPDGVWWVELAALADPALIPTTVAQALGVREEPGRTPDQTLKEYLRDRNLLLLLDNCEHLIGKHLTGGCAGFVADLLVRCPGLHVLATSRRPLGIPGEMAYEVPCLVQPDAGGLMPLDEFLQVESVRLLTDRARNARPDFAITQSTAPIVARLCRRLDGIPLAIELAVARIGVLSIAQIEERLEKVLTLPPMHASRPQHKTIRALIDWSHDLLTDAERTLFRRLAVFSGGWTLEAAEAVCADESIEVGDIIELLSNLRTASLILTEPFGDSERYRLLETVRQYALQRLAEAGELDACRDRHLDFFLSVAEEAAPHLTGSLQAVWLSRLEYEQDNLRAAFSWAVRGGAGLQLGGALWRYWLLHGHFTEGRGRLEGALARAHADNGPRPAAFIRARALNGAGVLATRMGDLSAGQRFLEEALRIRERHGDEIGISEAWNNLGNIALAKGDHAAARTLYENSLSLRRKFNDKWGIAASLNNLAIIARDLGDLDEAHRRYAESVAFYREIGDRAQVAMGLSNLGMTSCEQGNHAAARSNLEESLLLFRQMDNRWGISVATNNLAETYRQMGDLKASRDLFVECLDLRLEIGDSSGLTYPLEGLAHLAARFGEFQTAAILFACAAAIREREGTCLPPCDREEYDAALAGIRAGMAPDAFDRAWSTGLASTVQDLRKGVISAFNGMEPPRNTA